MRRFWVRWYGDPDVGFTLASPWWESGYAVDGATTIFVAAIQAADEEEAKHVVEAAYDDAGGILEWSFVNERADDWAPFCDRFPRADWMVWP